MKHIPTAQGQGNGQHTAPARCTRAQEAITAPQIKEAGGIVHPSEEKAVTIEYTAQEIGKSYFHKGIAQRNRNRNIKRYVNSVEKHIFEMSKIFQKPIDRNRNRML